MKQIVVTSIVTGRCPDSGHEHKSPAGVEYFEKLKQRSSEIKAAKKKRRDNPHARKGHAW